MPKDDSVRDFSISNIQKACNIHFCHESEKNVVSYNNFVIHSSKNEYFKQV